MHIGLSSPKAWAPPRAQLRGVYDVDPANNIFQNKDQTKKQRKRERENNKEGQRGLTGSCPLA